jgi:hypothetical protein
MPNGPRLENEMKIEWINPEEQKPPIKTLVLLARPLHVMTLGYFFPATDAIGAQWTDSEGWVLQDVALWSYLPEHPLAIPAAASR